MTSPDTGTRSMLKELPPIEARAKRHDNGERVVTAAEKKYAYYWLTRAKKSHAWAAQAVCYAAGDACFAVAETHFAAQGYTSENHALAKLVDSSTWHRFQVTQHLKMVGVK